MGQAPLWDCIHRTSYWDVVHSYNTGLLGWLVLVSRQHIAALDEMTEAQAIELGKLIRQVSIALREQTGCEKTYIAQFAEHPDHRHVHFHVMPRMNDQPEDRKGPATFKYLGVPAEQRVGEAAMNELAVGIQRSLIGQQLS